MQFQDYQGTDKDDTAANGFKFTFCMNGHWDKQREYWYVGDNGVWKDKVMCPRDTYVTGMKVRSESYQGGTIDDTALNGIRFMCKPWGST